MKSIADLNTVHSVNPTDARRGLLDDLPTAHDGGDNGRCSSVTAHLLNKVVQVLPCGIFLRGLCSGGRPGRRTDPQHGDVMR